jgi:phage shock protein PspC (stress-responsive transcriptional regulator)
MKKISLSKNDRKIFGICGGIGETYDIDPTMIRIILMFICLATGGIPEIVAYIIAWFIIPKKQFN